MARRNPSPQPASEALSFEDSTAAMMAAGNELFEQWMETQATWLSTWFNWQTQWLSEFQRQASELPNWLIWQNGTEQLA